MKWMYMAGLMAVACEGRTGTPVEVPVQGASMLPMASMEAPPEVELFGASDSGAPARTATEDAVATLDSDEAAAEVVVETPMPPEPVVVNVRAGESLALYADWSGAPIEALAEANDLEVIETLYPGQSLMLSLDPSEAKAWSAARETFHTARLERFEHRRGGVMSFEEVMVHTGDTAWDLARDAGRIPVWTLAAYNPDLDLDQIRVGDRVRIPVFGGRVEAAKTDAMPVDEASVEPVVVAKDHPDVELGR